MLLHRTRVDEGLDTHRTAIAALGQAVSRARHVELSPVEPGGGRIAARSVRLTDAPKSPSRRRSRGRGDLRAVAPSEVPVVPLAELVARPGRPAVRRSVG
jgi:hypothetical protein